ncbi:MAG: type VI secretion system baseplate subunit TssE [Gemmataceae bacterium]
MDSGDLRKIGMMPSVLDRIIDPSSLGTLARPGFSVEDLVASVRRDVEDLLNTRQNQDKTIDEFPLLAGSVYRFGMPEMVSMRASSPEDRQKIGRVLEKIIAQYEPRLSNIKAVLVGDTKDTTHGTVNFRIEGRLRLDPAPEVVFETLLEFATGQSRIEETSLR